MARRKGILFLALRGACLATLLLTGCSAETQKWILSTFFDGSDSPPPPTQRVRRDFAREIEELRRELAEVQQKLALVQEAAKGGKGPAEAKTLLAEQAKNWQEAVQRLPKDKSGRVEWTQAIRAGVIAPRPSQDPKAPDQAMLDLDVELASSGSKLYSVVFRHGPHTQWLSCKNCHPAIFPLTRQAKPTVVTMGRIQKGESCGVCHGKVAFGIDGQCVTCHSSATSQVEWRPSEEPRRSIEKARTWAEAQKMLPSIDGMADWSKALMEGIIAPRPAIDPKGEEQPVFPATVERVPAGQEAMKVLFPHDTHTQWLSCTNCHPGLFQMAKGASPMNMGLINAGKSCGVCHGSVAFAPTACGRCHPAMAGGK